MNRGSFVIFFHRRYQDIRKYLYIEYKVNARRRRFQFSKEFFFLPLFFRDDVQLHHSQQRYGHRFEEQEQILRCLNLFEYLGQVRFHLKSNECLIKRNERKYVFLREYFTPSRCFSLIKRAFVKPRISFLFFRPPARRTSRSPGRRVMVCSQSLLTTSLVSSRRFLGS